MPQDERIIARLSDDQLDKLIRARGLIDRGEGQVARIEAELEERSAKACRSCVWAEG